ncbi:MAG: iron ABC transporter substrate-binding protein, partial [Tannerellaceae bacterium]|nr:iron ABC transporter substrate-binding protein [Tannerellaceae bacterium]
MNKILLVCLVALLTVSCISKKERSQDMNASSTEASTSADRIVPQYAKGFEITYTNGYVLVDIQDPQYEE